MQSLSAVVQHLEYTNFDLFDFHAFPSKFTKGFLKFHFFACFLFKHF